MADMDEYLRKTYGPEYKKKIAYFKEAAPYAVIAGERLKMDPKILLAQTALESGWGKSGLAVRANNLAGVKAKPGQPYVEEESAEGFGPNERMVKSKFVTYPNKSSFFEDWSGFLKNKRYEDAIKQSDPAMYGKVIGQKGYYTGDQNVYANNIKRIHKDISRMMLDPNIVGQRINDSTVAGGEGER
jgi:flagellum-specific peptidoglycan hydrolase FlgJ